MCYVNGLIIKIKQTQPPAGNTLDTHTVTVSADSEHGRAVVQSTYCTSVWDTNVAPYQREAVKAAVNGEMDSRTHLMSSHTSGP